MVGTHWTDAITKVPPSPQGELAGKMGGSQGRGAENSIGCHLYLKETLREYEKSPGGNQETKSSPIPTTNVYCWGQVITLLWPLVYI